MPPMYRGMQEHDWRNGLDFQTQWLVAVTAFLIALVIILAIKSFDIKSGDFHFSFHKASIVTLVTDDWLMQSGLYDSGIL